MRLIKLLILCLTLLVSASISSLAQPQVPRSVQDNLGGIFGLWRDYLWEESDKFWHQGDYKRCIQMMRLITQVDPHDFDAYESGAWLLESELRDDEAEAFLLQGLEKNRDTYNLYYSLGYFYYFHERFDESVRYLQTAAVLGAPQLVWHQLAHAYEAAGYPEYAFETWSITASTYPEDPVPQNQMDRMMRGEPHSNTAHFVSRARQDRMREKEMMEKSGEQSP